MKALKTIEHAQIEFFILTIRISHVSSIDVYRLGLFKLFERMKL